MVACIYNIPPSLYIQTMGWANSPIMNINLDSFKWSKYLCCKRERKLGTVNVHVPIVTYRYLGMKIKSSHTNKKLMFDFMVKGLIIIRTIDNSSFVIDLEGHTESNTTTYHVQGHNGYKKKGT